MNNYPYTPLYYSAPVLVKYYDVKANSFNYGIAYHDRICTHTGEVILITTCIIEAQNHHINWDDAIIEQAWRDLNLLV